MILDQIMQSDMFTKGKLIPVYYYLPKGQFTLNNVTFFGSACDKPPMSVPASFYFRNAGLFEIAPITKDYLEYLFGNKRFAKATFNIKCLEIMSRTFLEKLASKVGANIKRTYTNAGIARRIQRKIYEAMSC